MTSFSESRNLPSSVIRFSESVGTASSEPISSNFITPPPFIVGTLFGRYCNLHLPSEYFLIRGCDAQNISKGWDKIKPNIQKEVNTTIRYLIDFGSGLSPPVSSV